MLQSQTMKKEHPPPKKKKKKEANYEKKVPHIALAFNVGSAIKAGSAYASVQSARCPPGNPTNGHGSKAKTYPQ